MPRTVCKVCGGIRGECECEKRTKHKLGKMPKAESPLTYQQAQEGIAIELYDQWWRRCSFDGFVWEELYENVKEQWRKKADRVLSLLFTPEEIGEWKKGGYPAIVCEDQSLPVDNSDVEAGTAEIIQATHPIPSLDREAYRLRSIADAIEKYKKRLKALGFRRVKGVK